jgi:polyhydroxyalkanoate synthesis regulator phasin/virulence-associated protein VagC
MSEPDPESRRAAAATTVRADTGELLTEHIRKNDWRWSPLQQAAAFLSGVGGPSPFDLGEHFIKGTPLPPGGLDIGKGMESMRAETQQRLRDVLPEGVTLDPGRLLGLRKEGVEPAPGNLPEIARRTMKEAIPFAQRERPYHWEKALAKGALNVGTDLLDFVSAVPGLMGKVLLPRQVYPGETQEEAAQRIRAEMEQLGEETVTGLVGGTAEMVTNPLESLVARPFSTYAVGSQLLHGAGKLTRAAKAARAGVPEVPPSAPVPPGGEPPPVTPPEPSAPQPEPGIAKRIQEVGTLSEKPPPKGAPLIDRALHNLREGLIKSGVGAGKALDFYLAKFADGFYSGDPRASVMTEEFARSKELAHAAVRSTAKRLAGAAAKELERGTPVPPGQLPGLPGEAAPATGALLAPEAPVPAPGLEAPETAGAPRLAAEPERPTAVGPVAADSARIESALREQLRGLEGADRAIADFMENLRGGDERAIGIAHAILNRPDVAQQIFTALRDSFAKRASQPPVPPEAPPPGAPPAAGPKAPVPPPEPLEQVVREKVYGAQKVHEEIPVAEPTDEAAARRVQEMSPDLKSKAREIADELMKRGKLGREMRHAVLQDVEHAVQDALGGEGKTANWKGQMRANPDRFAKDYLRAAQEKLGEHQMTRKVKAILLEAIDRRDSKGLELTAVEQGPDGQYRLVRKRTVPRTPGGKGGYVELDPAELVKPRRLTGDEVRNAVEAQLKEVARRHLKGAELASRLEGEAARAMRQDTGDVFNAVKDAVRKVTAEENVVPEDLYHGAKSMPEAQAALERVVHNILINAREGNLQAQVLPPGVRPAKVGDILRQFIKDLDQRQGRAMVRVSGEPEVPPVAEAGAPQLPPPERAGLPAPESGALAKVPEAVLEGEQPAREAAPQLGAPPDYEHLRIREPGAPSPPEPPIEAEYLNLSPSQKQGLKRLAWELQGYRPLPEDLGFGTKDTPAYAEPEMAKSLGWHVLSEQVLSGAKGAMGSKNPVARLLSWANSLTKSNLTEKSIAAGASNLAPNMTASAIAYGKDPVTFVNDAVKWIGEAEKYHTGNAAEVAPEVADAIKSVERAGVGIDFVSHELQRQGMTPAQKLRAGKIAAMLGDTRGVLPTTRFAQWLYKGGDQAVRLPVAIEEFLDVKKEAKLLRDGEHRDVYPSRRSMVRVSRKGGKWFAEDPYAANAKDRLPREITEDELNDLIGRHAAHKATYIVGDYPDMPQWIKALNASGLDVIASPFKSWAGHAMDMPGKPGLGYNIFVRDPFAVSTNNVGALVAAAGRNLQVALARSAIANGLRSALAKQGANGQLAQDFRSRPDNDQSVIIGSMTRPDVIEALVMGNWANIGPTMQVIGALEALAAQPEVAREKALGEKGQLGELGEEVVRAETGRDFNTKDAMRMAMLSGNWMANAWQAIQDQAKEGKTFDPSVVTDGLAGALVGGTNAALARGAMAYLGDTGPEAHPRIPVGDTRYAMAKLSGREHDVDQAMEGAATPIMMYMISQVLGKGWRAKDFNANNPEEVHSYLHKMGLSLKEAAATPAERTEREAAEKRMRQARPEEQGAVAKYNEERLQRFNSYRALVDNTVDMAWDRYVNAYDKLHNAALRRTMKPPSAGNSGARESR